MSQPVVYPSTRLAVFTYGGVDAHCLDSLVREAFFAAQHEVQPLEVVHVSDDALISRSRSRAATMFLEGSQCEVLVMIDRDISWRVGDAMHIARLAKERDAIVGGMYACRAYNQGFASRLKTDRVFFTAGGDKVHEAEHVATGFMAIPRSVLRTIVKQLATVDTEDGFPADHERIRKCMGLAAGDPSFYDLFRPVSVPATHELAKEAGLYEYLSEDWAFCRRAQAAGVPCLLSEKPTLLHWGTVPIAFQDGQRTPVGSRG